MCYLVLVKNSVADSGHEHHRDQEWNKTAVRHGVPIIVGMGLEAGRRDEEEEKRRGEEVGVKQSGDHPYRLRSSHWPADVTEWVHSG